MSSFRFAVIGDTHYCTMKNRPQTCASGNQECLPDYFRYAFMTDTLRVFADRIRAEKPELLISTGDLIEGGADDYTDEREARSVFASCAPVFALAPGTHDAPRKEAAYRKIIRENCVFLILDYTDWNETQKDWLIRELEESENAEHRFVFAHPPLHLFGRHFFYNPVFCKEMEEILNCYPVDIYFCGHTHNQSVSFHAGMLQIAGSAVGYAEQKTIPLEELHSVQDEPENRYLWGIAEDSTPAFWIIDVNGEELTLRWHSLKGSAGLRIKRRFAFPELISYPPFVRERVPLTVSDQYQIRTGWVNIFTANKGKNGFRLFLNGIDLGFAPESTCYAGRRFILPPQKALRTISPRNELEIIFPHSGTFAAGSISLELLLLDGRTIRSNVAPELFLCGEHPDFEYARSRAETVRPGERRKLPVTFQEEQK